MWAAKNITTPAVEKYLYGLLPASDPVLREMERVAQREDIPIVGPAVGRMLYLFAQLAGARRIFEMGSAIGYSTIWLARAAGEGAEVHYSDGDPQKAQRAEAYIRRAGVAERVRMHVGNSLDLLQEISGEFDLIFNDVDKQQYPEAARLAMPRLRRGGLFITDNTLWSGKAARKASKKDQETLGIQKFNRMVYAAKDFFTIIVPLRDGVTVCRKE
jgi:caffeoyl-CoA O-methyltransferase